MNQIRSEFSEYFNLRERFIQRFMKDGKKAIATKIFDEGLEVFYRKIQQMQEEDFIKQFGKSKNRKKVISD